MTLAALFGATNRWRACAHQTCTVQVGLQCVDVPGYGRIELCDRHAAEAPRVEVPVKVENPYLRQVRIRGPLTAGQVAQRLGITRRASEPELERLVVAGELERMEAFPAPRYRLLPGAPPDAPTAGSGPAADPTPAAPEPPIAATPDPPGPEVAVLEAGVIDVPAPVAGLLKDGLEPRILEALARGPASGNALAAALLPGRAAATLHRALRELEVRGSVAREGAGKHCRWRVVDGSAPEDVPAVPTPESTVAQPSSPPAPEPNEVERPSSVVERQALLRVARAAAELVGLPGAPAGAPWAWATEVVGRLADYEIRFVYRVVQELHREQVATRVIREVAQSLLPVDLTVGQIPRDVLRNLKPADLIVEAARPVDP